MRTFAIETWGCQMNHHDSERLAGRLARLGLLPAQRSEQPDLVLLNTCSVRDRPEQKILSRIGELARTNPKSVLGVCGCVAQQEGERLLAHGRSIGFVLGPGQIERVGEALDAVARGERRVLVGFDEALEHDFHTTLRTSRTRAMITVVEGCNEYCTFCVVPYTRGREVSRPHDEILAEMRQLAIDGFREVELLGQTINAYRCPETGTPFSALLEAVAQIPGIARVRFITSHPRHFDDDLIQVLGRHPKVSRYLHLPFQAGSDTILERMHRRYTRQEYLALISRIRSVIPDVNLSTDVIVGFPGETEADFVETLDLLERVRFGQVFAFGYSPRPFTPAAKYSGHVAGEIVSARLQRLFSLTDSISRELNSELVGRTLSVLIDGDSRRSAADWQGRADDNRVVNFPKNGRDAVGDIVPVRIVRAGPHSLVGLRPGLPEPLPVLGRVSGDTVKPPPARISHRPAAAARDTPALAVFSRLRVLDGPPSPTPRPSGRKRRHHRRLPRFASRDGEKCGLA